MFASFSFFGFFDVHLINIFLFFAAFFGTFVFWRRLHLNASYKEFEIFDFFLLALLYGFIGGRLAFVIADWPNFGWRPLAWINIFSHPGISVIIAIITAGFSLHLMLRHYKINRLDIMDYWAQATCFGLIISNLGRFFAGDGIGYLTTGPLGISFPNLAVKVHPIQLYNVVFFLLLYIWLNYLEKNYRTYKWYRGSRSSADPGFLLFIFIIFSSAFSLLTLIFSPPQFFFADFALDWIIDLLLLIFGLILLIKHSSFHFHVHKRK